MLLLSSCHVGVDAQDFECLPPVVVKSPGKKVSATFMLSAQDTHRNMEDYNERAYSNSIQIIDANQPWPPIWYTSTPCYSNEMFSKDSAQGINAYNWLLDAKVEHGNLSFFKLQGFTKNDSIASKPIDGYIVLNKNMDPIDTVSCKIHAQSSYWHDFRINERGERLVDFKIFDVLDLRTVTGQKGDSAVKSQIDFIHILDSANNVIFSWKATDHLDPKVFQFYETLHNKSFIYSSSDGPYIDWSHLTSAIWDYDGNILYSFRWVGIGKISRKDGHLIWHIDYKDLPIISGNDTIEWYSPHDLNLLYDNDTASVYSIFSCGRFSRPMHGFKDSVTTKNARVVIFEINKKTNKIKLVRYLDPNLRYVAKGQGGCDYQDEANYLISYGQGHCGKQYVDANNFSDAFEWRHDGIISIFQMPRYVGTWKVHQLTSWPVPSRPKIIFVNKSLHAEGVMTDWTWYKMTGKNNMDASMAGKGETLTPEHGATYCVVGKYGVGYCVSLPFKVEESYSLPLWLIAVLGCIILITCGIIVFNLSGVMVKA